MRPSASFQDIDKLRQARGLSAQALCKRASVSFTAWWRAQNGAAWRRDTERKLREALEGERGPKAAPRPDPVLVRAAYKGHLALQAARLGVDVNLVLKSRARDFWELRALAMFSTSVEFDIRGADLARALGMSRQIVSWNIKQANALKDENLLGRLSDEADRHISPEAAE